MVHGDLVSLSWDSAPIFQNVIRWIRQNWWAVVLMAVGDNVPGGAGEATSSFLMHMVRRAQEKRRREQRQEERMSRMGVEDGIRNSPQCSITVNDATVFREITRNP